MDTLPSSPCEEARLGRAGDEAADVTPPKLNPGLGKEEKGKEEHLAQSAGTSNPLINTISRLQLPRQACTKSCITRVSPATKLREAGTQIGLHHFSPSGKAFRGLKGVRVQSVLATAFFPLCCAFLPCPAQQLNISHQILTAFGRVAKAEATVLSAVH